MRRHRIQYTVGDRVYYQYWNQRTNEIVMWVRPRLYGAFRREILGRFKVKSEKVPLTQKWAFGTAVEFGKPALLLKYCKVWDAYTAFKIRRKFIDQFNKYRLNADISHCLHCYELAISRYMVELKEKI